MKHLNIHVHGKVQGVWFRASTKEAATNLGIRGFVRNEADGSVYLEAEGEDKALQELLAWLAEGPPRAEVESVTNEEAGLKHFKGFEISR